MLKTIVLLGCILLLAQVSSVQAKIINGTVYDDMTGESLPNANIQILGTYSGTISNVQGKYVLQIAKVPAKVKVSYIGYFSQTLTITNASSKELDIRLKPTVIEFAPIIVTDRDPAMDIMEKLIEKKQQWRKSLDTIQFEAYFRMVFANDTSIACIAERVSDVFWDKEKGFREIVKSAQQTQNIKELAFIPASGFMINMYDDNINFMDHNLIGPTHPDALKHYRFRLTGQSMLDDKIVFEIEVTPRSKLQSCFIGNIKVLDEDFAMIDTDLRPNQSLQFPIPIQKVTANCRQQFANFGGTYWLPIDIRLGFDLNVGISGLHFPTIRLNQVSRLTDYQINVELPDTLYKEGREWFTEAKSFHKDTLLASNPIIVPLSEQEQLAYVEIEKDDKLEDSFKPTGLLARLAELSIKSGNGDNASEHNENPDTTRDDQKKGFNLGLDFSSDIWYNRVDALHAGLSVKHSLGKRLQLKVSGGYATGLEKWSYGGGASFKIFNKPHSRIYASYNVGSRQQYESEIYAPWYTSLVSLAGNKDYYNYYWNKAAVAGLELKLRPLNTRMALELHNEQHSSLEKTSDFSLTDKHYTRLENPVIEDGTLRSMVTHISMGDNFTPVNIVGQKRLSLRFEHSDKDVLGGDFNFTSVQGSLDWRFNTLFSRRMIPNTLDVRITAATSFGDLPVQRYTGVDARNGLISPFGVLNSVNGRPLLGEKSLGIFWEHNFRTVPFELLGLDWFTKRIIYLAIHGATARTWIDKENEHHLNYRDKTIQELGVSVDNLFNFVRVNATRRLDEDGWTFSIGVARMF